MSASAKPFFVETMLLFLAVTSAACGARARPVDDVGPDADSDTDSDSDADSDTDTDTDADTDTDTDTDTGTETDSDSATDAEDRHFCEDLVDATGDGLGRCCPDELSQDADDGLAFLADACIEQVDGAIAAGRSAFHEELAADCLAAVADSFDGCPVPLPAAPACDGVYEGLQVEGGECSPGLFAFADECVGDLVCLPEDFEHASATCRAPLAEGEPCDAAECASGLYCEGVCRTPPAVGEPCGRTPFGAAVLNVCGPDAYCDEEDVCRAAGAQGAPCEWDTECLSLHCDEGSCSDLAQRYCI